MEKTKVVTTHEDKQYSDWKKDESGYIDGYVRGGNNVPYAVVVLGERLVMIPLHSLKVVTP